MTRIGRVAMVFAVLLSAVSIADAVQKGLTGRLLLDQETSPGWVTAVVNVLLAATFGLLAAVLVEQADWIDAGSRLDRWVRRLLLGDLAILSGAFLTGPVVRAYGADGTLAQVWGAVGGIGFLLMFVFGIALGACLLRRPELRAPATLIAAPAALIPLTFLIEVVAPGWGHPGYAETALYVGVALLGRHAPTWTGRTSPALSKVDHVSR